MIALRESGLSAGDIAKTMGVSRLTVVNRLSGLSMEDSAEDRKFWRMIADGSERLAARLNEVRGMMPQSTTLGQSK